MRTRTRTAHENDTRERPAARVKGECDAIVGEGARLNAGEETDGNEWRQVAGPVTAGHRTPDGNRPWLSRDGGEAQVMPEGHRPWLPRDAAEARARVAEALDVAEAATGAGASAQARGDALLVASELVTNAMRHGGGLTGFGVEIHRGVVTITVADQSGELPHLADAQGRKRAFGPAEGGFGWPLIRLLAREIRLRLLPQGGKTIEVRLPLH